MSSSKKNKNKIIAQLQQEPPTTKPPVEKIEVEEDNSADAENEEVQSYEEDGLYDRQEALEVQMEQNRQETTSLHMKVDRLLEFLRATTEKPELKKHSRTRKQLVLESSSDSSSSNSDSGSSSSSSSEDLEATVVKDKSSLTAKAQLKTPAKKKKKVNTLMSPTPVKLGKQMGQGNVVSGENNPTVLRAAQNIVKQISKPSLQNIRTLITQLKSHEYTNLNYPISIAQVCSDELKVKLLTEIRNKYPMMADGELVKQKNDHLLKALAQIEAPETETQWLEKIREALVFPPLVAWQKETKAFLNPSETTNMVVIYTQYLLHAKEVMQYADTFWNTPAQLSSRPPTFRPSGGYETNKNDNLASCIIDGDRRSVLKHLHDMFPIIATRKMEKIYEYLEEMYTRLVNVKTKAQEYAPTYNLIMKMSTLALPDPKSNSKEENVRSTQSAWNIARINNRPAHTHTRSNHHLKPPGNSPAINEIRSSKVDPTGEIDRGYHDNEVVGDTSDTEEMPRAVWNYSDDEETPATIAEMQPPMARPKRACMMQMQGECKRGNDCTFSHDKSVLIEEGRKISRHIEQLSSPRGRPPSGPRNTKVYQSQPVAEMDSDEGDANTYKSPFAQKAQF